MPTKHDATKTLSGFHAALLTPFAQDGGRIAHDSLGRLVRRNVDAGLSGVYVGGSTGECFLMTPDERIEVLAVAAEAANGDLAIIAQVGDTNPDVSLRLAREALRLGYDAISAVPPFYYSYRFPEIREHYRRLAIATDLPFLVYNFPALSGVRLTAEQLAELVDLPNVLGVKNTCADHHAFERLRTLRPDATLLNGFDEALLSGLSLGADGGIGSTYNVQADLVIALAKAFDRGDIRAAQKVQAQMNSFIDVLIDHGVFPSLKHALTVMGIPMGPCRAPFAPLGAEARADIETAIEVYLRSSGAGSAPATVGE